MTLTQYFDAFGPELILTLGAFIALALGLSKSEGARQATGPLCLLAVILAMVAAGRSSIEPSLTAPMGFRLGLFAEYVRWITLIVGGLVLLIAWRQADLAERGEFFALVLFSLVGVMLTAAADDLIVLFFALELVSVPTYILVAVGRLDIRAQEGGVKYFFLGALSAALMAYGFSFLYGVGGTTTMTGLDQPGIAAALSAPGGLAGFGLIGLLLAIGGVLFKMAAVPFHVYAPDVYQGAPSPVTGMLGFVPKLAGLVALTRLLSLAGWQTDELLLWVIWTIAALTMIVGNVLALLQTNVKRTLAYSSIAHTGYILIGVLVGPYSGRGPMHDGIAAAMFYIAVYGLMNLGAFGVLTYLRVRDREAETFEDLSGLSQRFPGAALAMAVCCFSLMGFPPTAGFLGKVYLFSSAFSLPPDHAFRVPLIVLAVIGVLASAVGAVYYLRIIAYCYLRPVHKETTAVGGLALQVGLGICAWMMLLLFIYPQPITDRALQATREFRTPTGHLVQGDGGTQHHEVSTPSRQGAKSQ